jgi:hypothetical protein
VLIAVVIAALNVKLLVDFADRRPAIGVPD